jgi:hypothetical protein
MFSLQSFISEEATPYTVDTKLDETQGVWKLWLFGHFISYSRNGQGLFQCWVAIYGMRMVTFLCGMSRNGTIFYPI